MPDLTGGGNYNDIAHGSLIQVNTVRYDATMPQQAQAGVSELSE